MKPTYAYIFVCANSGTKATCSGQVLGQEGPQKGHIQKN